MRSVASSPTVKSAPVFNAVARAAQKGLTARPKRLPAWLFYDSAGSRLFEAITRLDEYYLTRTERGIFAENAARIVRLAAGGARLRVTELGAGSAEKTSLLLAAASAVQGGVVYEPIDVSESALAGARERLTSALPGVRVVPRLADYTRGDGRALELDPLLPGERRLMLSIGSSIGNFDPDAASLLLRRVRSSLAPGDGFLAGVDLVKGADLLHAAYDDEAGVTAAFNRNVLARLNRELGADFDPASFAHLAVWNSGKSRVEMHLASLSRQRVHIAALRLTVDFAQGETIHTESSYKYTPQRARDLLEDAGLTPETSWTDPRGWFLVVLARAA